MEQQGMEKRQAKNALIVVGLKGCEVACVGPDGEVVFEYGLTPGKHKMSQITDLMGDRDRLNIGNGGVVLLRNNGRMVTMNFGERAFETAANPDFQPSAEFKEKRQMQAMMNTINEKVDRVREELSQERDQRLREQQERHEREMERQQRPERENREKAQREADKREKREKERQSREEGEVLDNEGEE